MEEKFIEYLKSISFSLDKLKQISESLNRIAEELASINEINRGKEMEFHINDSYEE